MVLKALGMRYWEKQTKRHFASSLSSKWFPLACSDRPFHFNFAESAWWGKLKTHCQGLMAISLHHSGHKQMLLSSILGIKYSLGQVCVGCADCSKIRERLRVRGVRKEREHSCLSRATQFRLKAYVRHWSMWHENASASMLNAILCFWRSVFDFYLMKYCKCMQYM